MASVYPKGKRWRAQTYIRGKRSSKVFPSESQARAWADRMEGAAAGMPALRAAGLPGRRFESYPGPIEKLYRETPHWRVVLRPETPAPYPAGMPRTYYPTKAAWAEAQADAHALAVTQISATIVPAGDWRGVKAKMDGIALNRADERRYRRMAEAFRRRAA